MKNERFRIRAGLMVALALLDHQGGDIQAQTQDPVWALGNTQVTFPNWTQTNLGVQPLPTPSDASIPQQYRYDGTVAVRSQFAQYDREGKLLFFAVDGNIYNANGYLIADAGVTPGDRNCRVCTFKGNEFHVVPVPGSCSRYYVISLFGDDGEDEVVYDDFETQEVVRSRIRIGVLDLTLLNDFPVYNNALCAIRGRFMANVELGEPGINLLQDFDAVDTYGVDGDLVEGDPQYYLAEASLHAGNVGVGMVHAASIELENDLRVVMMVRTGNKLIPMIITENGVRRLPGSTSQGYYPMTWLQDSEVVHDVVDNDRSFRGELALRQVGSELRVAYSSYFEATQDQLFNENRVTYWRFQLLPQSAPAVLGFTMVPYTSPDPNPRQYATDQTLPNTTDPPLDHLGNVVARPSICGLEFSPNGQYLYFTKSGRGYEGSYTPNFGYIDVTVQCAPAPAVCNAIFFPSTGDPNVIKLSLHDVFRSWLLVSGSAALADRR